MFQRVCDQEKSALVKKDSVYKRLDLDFLDSFFSFIKSLGS